MADAEFLGDDDDPVLRNDDDDDDVRRLAPQAIATLKQAWATEKAAPELLPYEEQAVDILRRSVTLQEADSAAGAKDGIENAFLYALYSTELGRLRFLLNAYLRTRLWKIEQFVHFVTSNDEARAHLSAAELTYAHGAHLVLVVGNGSYMALTRDHGQHTGLVRLTDTLTHSDDDNPRRGPDLDTFVFCRAEEDVGRLGPISSFAKDDTYILNYQLIAASLRENKFRLL